VVFTLRHSRHVDGRKQKISHQLLLLSLSLEIGCKPSIDNTYVQECIKLDAPSILVNAAKYSPKSKRRPFVLKFRVRVFVQLIFRFGLELLFVLGQFQQLLKTQVILILNFTRINCDYLLKT